MYRRGFLRSVGSLAAIPAVGFAKAPPKNWHCLIGGNRAGKSAKAAKMVSQYEFVCCVVRDGWHFDSLKADFGGSLLRGSPSMCCWPDVFMPGLNREDLLETMAFQKRSKGLCKIALWIDECTPELDLKIAEVFDIVVLSSWPRHEILDMPFYQECLRMGTVEHMSMLPRIRNSKDGRDLVASMSEKERRVRVEGKFA